MNSPESSAPKFQVGNVVALRSDPGTPVPVLEVIPGGAETRYSVFQEGSKATYYESQLRHLEQAAETALLRADELHAYLTSLYLQSSSSSNLYSLRSGRVQFVPYQYRPVLRLIRSDRLRMLIADEVGVGKTIEAGLIIKELRARMDISSVLVICPKALVAARKWYLEMKRFDEHFTELDGNMLRHCLRETQLEGEWPDQYAKAIVPFSLFNTNLLYGNKSRRKSKGLLDLDPPPQFDLVIVDEAHHIRNAETRLHQAVRYFCDNAQAAVFLTATPVQMGSQDLFTLLNVLRPDLIIDRPSFAQMAAPNRSINMAVQYVRAAEQGWQAAARACMDEAAATEWGKRLLKETPTFQDIYDQLGEERIADARRVRLVKALEELYTFSSIINRTRRRDIGAFTTRKPETLSIEFTPAQRSLHDGLFDLVTRILESLHGRSNVKFMTSTLRRQAASCLYGLAPLLRDILAGKLDSLETIDEEDDEVKVDSDFLVEIKDDVGKLLEECDRLDPRDPKIEEFVRVLHDKSQMAKNKTLVFSTYRHTLAYLARHIEDAGLRYGLIHGGVDDAERTDLRHRFALPQGHPEALDILLSSEVGSEGLDYEFCDLLVNYDLPWNPMRIEQRIGRIDRYGQQSETVAVVNLIAPGTVDAEIYQRCLWRIGVFHHAVGGSEEILGEITSEILNIAENYRLTSEERAQRLQQLGDNALRRIQEESDLEEKQAELFGLEVPEQSWNQEIKSADNFWLTPEALRRCVVVYLSKLTDTAEERFLLGAGALKTLRLNHEARSKLLEDFKNLRRSSDPVDRQWEKWLMGPEPMLSVTFDQKTAAADPEVIHLNILHPLVRQAGKRQERSDLAQVNLTVVSDVLPTGEYPFVLYRWSKVGVRSDDSLIAVAKEPVLCDHIMSLLAEAADRDTESGISEEMLNEIEDQHYRQWSDARANHVAENKALVDRQLQSLKASHQARCSLLNDQIHDATDDRIRRMKVSELARATTDYEGRVAKLEDVKNKADIHFALVISGTLHIVEGGIVKYEFELLY